MERETNRGKEKERKGERGERGRERETEIEREILTLECNKMSRNLIILI